MKSDAFQLLFFSILSKRFSHVCILPCSDISRASITIVTYGLLRHPASRLVQEALSNQRFEVVIVDESHYIKNRKSAGTKFLVPLLQSASHKLLLSGTPALARPDEVRVICVWVRANTRTKSSCNKNEYSTLSSNVYE